MMLTPHGAIFPTGRVVALNETFGIITKVSEFLVKNGKFCTKDIHGKIIPYQRIIDFKKEGDFEI